MVRPAAFGFNPQTAKSNSFQKEIQLSRGEIQEKALVEFDLMVGELGRLGVEVVVANDKKEPFTPDAVFPNNWFSTHIDKTLCLYPMEAQARRLERDPETISLIESEAKIVRKLDFSDSENKEKYLEGTGSLVLDRDKKIAYACISSRTNEEVLSQWAESLNFHVVKFSAVDEMKKAIYHTNVMMCVGDEFAVVCLSSINDEGEKLVVRESLESSGKETIEISYAQMNSFAGNMLLLKTKQDEKLLVMSQRAFDSLETSQIEKLERYANLASFDIETIEDCGGGSVRCMIAEIF